MFRIFEGDDDTMSVYLDENDHVVISYTWFTRVETIRLTPLEAQSLSQILKSVCSKTEYFQGLKKEN